MSRTIILEAESDTLRLAQQIAPVLRSGDVTLLEGPIGAGKTFFARAVIRALAGAEIDVPSPTFSLVQVYELPMVDIWHGDLYRLSDTSEIYELGLDEAFENAICLIEWPDRLGALAPPDALTLTFAAQADHHTVQFSANGTWGERLAGFNG